MGGRIRGRSSRLLGRIRGGMIEGFERREQRRRRTVMDVSSRFV